MNGEQAMIYTTVNTINAMIAAMISALVGIAMFAFRHGKRMKDFGDESK